MKARQQVYKFIFFCFCTFEKQTQTIPSNLLVSKLHQTLSFDWVWMSLMEFANAIQQNQNPPSPFPKKKTMTIWIVLIEYVLFWLLWAANFKKGSVFHFVAWLNCIQIFLLGDVIKLMWNNKNYYITCTHKYN